MLGIEPVLEILKEELLEKCSTINGSIGKNIVLKKRDFEVIAEIIRTVLDQSNSLNGFQEDNEVADSNTTISVSTLERLFKYGYNLQLADQRVINTLNKLSRVLGYREWSVFVDAKSKNFNVDNNAIKERLFEIIREGCQAEFNAYKSLPTINLAEIGKHNIMGGPAYNRIKLVLEEHSRKKWVINNEGNSSYFDIFGIKLMRINSREAMIESEEQVYLRWFDLNAEKYCYIYNERNLQIYHLLYVDGDWKIKTNYYPKAANPETGKVKC